MINSPTYLPTQLLHTDYCYFCSTIFILSCRMPWRIRRYRCDYHKRQTCMLLIQITAIAKTTTTIMFTSCVSCFLSLKLPYKVVANQNCTAVVVSYTPKLRKIRESHVPLTPCHNPELQPRRLGRPQQPQRPQQPAPARSLRPWRLRQKRVCKRCPNRRLACQRAAAAL